ncbi:hypothetical protein NQ318_015230 [Aromia moschata]|uniref:PiggyBac transposable element-derived protein domain-containing protein n=1 Tax=Aromia moschata TaxID=1265417 RepID=A0AAV8XJX9_9CUCU|nr:hypothetical protein NQ318_015230 [Aromia moschata]
MSYLTESLKIEILMMTGYGDRARTQCEVFRLFRETHPDLPPLNQGTISKIEALYREMGHVRKVPSKRQAVVDDDTKLNLLLALEENPITPARQLARDSNLNHKTVLKILKYEKKRPYKMQAVQELLEDDPDRRVLDVPLMEDLLQQQIYARGTVNSTRQKLPKFKSDKELKRGEYDWYCSNSGLSAVKWRDKRSVHLLSNYHDPSSGTEVKRKKKDGTHEQVPCRYAY